MPNAGTTLSSAAWNDIVSQVNGLAGAMTVSSGKVGIGVASPVAKLDVGGRIRTTGNVYWSECGGRYLCSPMTCYNLCKTNGDRMANREEVFTIALRGSDSCAHGWYYYSNQADGAIHYAAGYPMGNASLPGCGNGVAGTPRFNLLPSSDTVDLNSATRADCYCSGL